MQMYMLIQRLPPGMQDSTHSQFTTQAFRIPAKAGQGVPHRMEQQSINHPWMKPYPTIEGMWQSKHQMIVGDWQQMAGLLVTPLLGRLLLAACAMAVATSMVQRGLMPALSTVQHKATHHGGAALLQVTTDTQLLVTQCLLFLQSR